MHVCLHVTNTYIQNVAPCTITILLINIATYYKMYFPFLLLGKVLYAHCIASTSNCRDDVVVSNEGIVRFDLRLTFSASGRAGQLQKFIRTTVRKEVNPLLTVTQTHTLFIHTPNRHWTIEGNNTRTRVAVLHNAVASDRGQYRIISELIDPATGSISTITKQTSVTGKELMTIPLDNAQILYILLTTHLY